MGRSVALLARWACNEFDQVTVLRDDNSRETAFTYDSLGRRTQES